MSRIGDNHGPPIDPREFAPANIDPHLVDLAWTSLNMIALVLKRDPVRIAQKRKGDENLSIRQAWLYCMKPHFGRDDKHDLRIAELAAAAQKEVKRIEAAHKAAKATGKPKASALLLEIRAELKQLREESLSKQKMLAAIVGLDRGTVSDDQAYMEALRKENGLVAQKLDELADMLEPLPSLLREGADFVADMALEHKLKRKKPPAPIDASPDLSLSSEARAAVLSIKDAVLRATVAKKWGVAV